MITGRYVSACLFIAALLVLWFTGNRPKMPTTFYEWECLTGSVVGCLLAIGIVYDVFARICGGNDATISACVQDWSRAWPVIPAALFFTLGHIFWPVRQ